MLILPLSGRTAAGRFTVVDAEDFDWLRQRRWVYDYRPPRSRSAQRRGHGSGFAGRRGNTIHRAILGRYGRIDGNVIWHLNAWGLDNRKVNLRTGSKGMNKRFSDYRNVHKIDASIWRVVIGTDKIGDFNSEAEAEDAYEREATLRGFITKAVRQQLILPVLEFLESKVESGDLVRHDCRADLIEDRYRINPTSKIDAQA